MNDLRHTRFQDVTFHAGQTRSGLLAGKPALEGSKTGYYLEGTTDDAWASPESLRQASFGDADLRGATFENVDLFHIDFRGTLLDDALRSQARQAGAIL